VSATVIKEFLVALNFDVNKSGASTFASSIADASVKAATLGAAVLGAAAAVTKFVTSVASELDVVGDLAERTENAASEIDKMGYIAELTDSSINAVNTSLEALNKNAGDTAMGIGRAKKVFEEIGVEVKDANGKLKNSTDLMHEVAGAIKDMDKGQQQAVLERLGIDRTMLKMLTTDVSALSGEYDKMMEAAGFSFDEAVKNAGELEDAQIKLKLGMTKLKQAVAASFFKPLAKSFAQFNDLLIRSMPAIIKTITPIIAIVMKVADVFIFLGSVVLRGIGVIVDGLTKLNDITNGWAGYILAAAAAWTVLNGTFLLSPIGLILALAAAIALLVDDFQTWKEGGESLIPWENWKNEVDLVIGFIDMLRSNIESSFSVIFAVVDGLIKLLTGDFSGAWTAAKDAASSFMGLFKNTSDFADKAMNYTPTPTPAQGAAMSGSGANVSQQTVINVNGGDPVATGRAVAGEQSRVNGDMARNMKGAAR
jgi:methyl-accepting chemotaxis protein